jgi:hypothetical protein
MMSDVLSDDKRILNATIFISNGRLPDGFRFGPSMLCPMFWTPLHDFARLCRFIEIGYHHHEVFPTRLPSLFGNAPVECIPSPSWLSRRMRLLVCQIDQIIPPGSSFAHRTPCSVDDFPNVQPRLFDQSALSFHDQRQILRFLDCFGIPDNDSPLW